VHCLDCQGLQRHSCSNISGKENSIWWVQGDCHRLLVYPDDIKRCVKDTEHSWVLDWPQVPDVWPVLSGTNLTHEETLLLQDAGFKLQEQPSMSPRRMFALSNLFEAPVFDHLGPPNPDVHPSTLNSKSVRQNANAPTAKHHNKSLQHQRNGPWCHCSSFSRSWSHNLA
jgi:hypothetical protein